MRGRREVPPRGARRPGRWDEIPAEGDDDVRGHAALITELTDRGVLQDFSPLAAPDDGVLVTCHGGEVRTSGDPAIGLEGRPHLAGYYLIEAGSLEEAVAVAARVPDARQHGVIVRPVMSIDGITA